MNARFVLYPGDGHDVSAETARDIEGFLAQRSASGRCAARHDHVSVSAWITAAARRELMVRDGLSAIAEWEKEHGAFNERELDEARASVGHEHAAKGRRRRSR